MRSAMRATTTDRLLCELTAFRGLADLRKSATAHGYIPSIYAADGPAYRYLTRLLRLRGVRVYDGEKVA